LQTGVLDACYRLGRLQFDVGLLAESLQTLRKGLAIVEPIAAADRKNVLAQRQVVLLKDAIGRVALAQGRIDEALALARANLANADRFAKSDPKNAVWQSYLAVGHERVGDALVARGDPTAALEAYRTEASILGIRATSGQSDPDALMWLSTARFKIGEILRTQNHRGEAEDHFGAALALRDTLLSSNPDVVAYQAGRLQARWRVLEAEPAASEQSAVLASLRELRDAGKLTYEYQTWLAQAEHGLDRPPAP
jgi:tetratricopeptide (TPR) repeat protein